MTQPRALVAVAAARRRADGAGAAYALARRDLDAAIVSAATDSPATYRDVAEVAGMSAGRVAQIVQAAREAQKGA